MEMHTQVQPSEFIDEPMEPPDTASLVDASVDADAIRSENNILAWMAYLPEDCIKKMIEMKWDLTT